MMAFIREIVMLKKKNNSMYRYYSQVHFDAVPLATQSIQRQRSNAHRRYHRLKKGAPRYPANPKT